MHYGVKVLRPDISKGKRILVTSDIHGHLEFFQKLLIKASFGPDDVLIIVGDIIEKGPASLKTLRCIMSLSEKGNVYPLMGNVDLNVLQMIENADKNADDLYSYLQLHRTYHKTDLIDEMARECGVNIDCAKKLSDICPVLLEKFKKEWDFIRNLPTLLEVGNYIFVHGGMPVRTTAEINEDISLYRFLKYNNFMSENVVFDKYVVVGHWPVSLYNDRIQQYYPVFDGVKHIISIDGGCGIHRCGQLNMIAIPDIESNADEIITYYYDAFPTVKATCSQKPSVDNVYIKWPDTRVEVLRTCGDFALIRHCSTGNELVVPADRIYNGTSLEAYTNRMLEVSCGEELSLIKRYSNGCIVKKDGEVGWYYGAVKEIEKST